MERDGIRVKTRISYRPSGFGEQTFEEAMVFEVDDDGRQLTISGSDLKRVVYAQEFLRFVSERPDFEFVGWWNDWDLSQPVEQARKVNRPIVLLRRS